MSSRGTILLTGANGGLGSAIVSSILRKPDIANNYTGLYTVRKAATASHLNSILAKAPPSHEHQVVDLDLSSIANIRKVAAGINRKVASGELPPIKVLILNAAYQDHLEIHMSDDGFEMTWQVNFLANQLLTLLLLQSMDKQGRILIIGSWSHDIDDPRNNAKDTPYQGYTTLFPSAQELAKGQWSRPESGGGWVTGYRRYGASKLCAVMLMHELAQRLAEDPQLSGITVAGLDPGAMGTELLRRGSLFFTVLSKVLRVISVIAVKFNPNGLYRPTWKSADDALRLCFEVDVPKGKAVYLNGTDEAETSRESKDEKKRKELWSYGIEVTHVQSKDTVLQNWQ